MIRLLVLLMTVFSTSCFVESRTAIAAPGSNPSATSRPKNTQLPKRRRAKSAKQSPARRGFQKRREDVSLSTATLPQEISFVGKLLKQRAYRAILTKANRLLASDPVNSNLHAARIVGCRHFGDHACIAQSYDEAKPSTALDLLREVARADALRHTGQAQEAARIRRALFVENARPQRRITLLTELALDLLAASQLEDAHDTAWQAIALDPESPDAWALVARVEAATGRFEEAESYLWLADRLGRPSLPLAIARTEVLVSSGDPHEAVTAALRPTIIQRKSLEHTILRYQAFLATGLYAEVLDDAHETTWRLGNELWHPHLMAAVGEALALDGQAEEAGALAVRLAATCPESAPAQAAAQAIHRHLASSQSHP